MRLPQFPLYIPSKGRADHSLTSNFLTSIGVPHTLVIEPHEYEAYAASRQGTLARLLVLDLAYKDRYELCDHFGLRKSTGSGPARNFIWDQAQAAGHAWHWIMDDNIRNFVRFQHNTRIKVQDATCFCAMEQFALRYSNLATAGPNCRTFAVTNDHSPKPPLYLNTRIYSCNLIRCDVPFRWRGRYNEDTILSLDMLKAGWCTVLFNVWLQDKLATQTVPGGNTTELYQQGTLAKSQMLVREHPDVARLSRKYGRIHHHVNYKGFRQPLRRKPDVPPAAEWDLHLVSV
jgi:hypothetical protein